MIRNFFISLVVAVLSASIIYLGEAIDAADSLECATPVSVCTFPAPSTVVSEPQASVWSYAPTFATCVSCLRCPLRAKLFRTKNIRLQKTRLSGGTSSGISDFSFGFTTASRDGLALPLISLPGGRNVPSYLYHRNLRL